MLLKKSEMIYEEKGEIEGQMVMVRFEREDWKETGITLWYMMLFIGDKVKDYKRWLKGKNYNENKSVNGNIGLKGLRFALLSLLSFQKELKENEIIIIDGTDTKRKKAYRYLKRYSDFNEVSFERRTVVVGFPPKKEEEIKKKLFNQKNRWKV